METVCAWCGTFLPGSGRSQSPVSHAICAVCFDELERALRENGLRPGASAGRGFADPRAP